MRTFFYSHIVDVKSTEENMEKLNWLKAFVIVAIIFARAFVYKTPIGAPLVACDGIITNSFPSAYMEGSVFSFFS